MTVPAKIKKLLRKGYRDAYMQTTVRAGIAYQIQAMRGKLSQSEFAKKIGKYQSDVSKLENEEQGQVSVQTLLDIASALDVALLVRFVDYEEFLNRTKDKSAQALTVETVEETSARIDAVAPLASTKGYDVYVDIPAGGSQVIEIGGPATWRQIFKTNLLSSAPETPSDFALPSIDTSMPTSAKDAWVLSTSH